MDEARRLGSLGLAVAAAIATVLALSWRAAEEGRGLDLRDLRSVVLVAAIVLATALWLDRREGQD